MLSNDGELNLQPIDTCIVQCEQRKTQDRIQRAAAQLELERILADAEACDESVLVAIGSRFGIRHILWGTALTAFVLAMFKALGLTGGVVAVPLVMLLGAWLLVNDREKIHAQEVSHRLREHKRQHPSAY